jgi:hypothetical protein
LEWEWEYPTLSVSTDAEKVPVTFSAATHGSLLLTAKGFSGVLSTAGLAVDADPRLLDGVFPERWFSPGKSIATSGVTMTTVASSLPRALRLGLGRTIFTSFCVAAGMIGFLLVQEPRSPAERLPGIIGTHELSESRMKP